MMQSKEAQTVVVGSGSAHDDGDGVTVLHETHAPRFTGSLNRRDEEMDEDPAWSMRQMLLQSAFLSQQR
jgi:hypothetical protein